MSEQDSLYSFLTSLGHFYPLSISFNEDALLSQLESCRSRWRPYNSNKPGYKREGLSLFSLDGSDSGEIDLNSVREHNEKNGTSYNELSFRVPTSNWEKLQALSSPLKSLVPFLGRTHIIRLDEGGFFPPHRDLGDSFRLISFFGCTPRSLHVALEGQNLHFHPGALYFMDTRRVHSVFSFRPDAYFLVLNVELSEGSRNWLIGNLLEV